MRYFFVLLFLFLLLLSCHKEEPSQARKLCELIHEKPTTFLTYDSIAPILKQASQLTPAEHYAVVCKAVLLCLTYTKDEVASQILQNSDSLTFHGINQKDVVFLILEQYASRKLPKQLANFKELSTLLFNMENRQHLTPEEKCRFLTLKSGIYFINFQEYESAVSIAREAATLAAQHNITGKPLTDIYSMLIRSYLQLDADEKNLRLGYDFLNDIDNKLIDNSFQQIPHELLRLLYMKEGDYQKAWYYVQKSKHPLKSFNPTTVKLLLGMDSIPQLLAYLQKLRANLTVSEKLSPDKKEIARQIFLYEISSSEACAYRQSRDTNRYVQYLSEAIGHFDRLPSGTKLKTAAIQEYAGLLWEQGKRNEAIRRMEQVTRVILKAPNSFSVSKNSAFENAAKDLLTLRQLIHYYSEAGRPEDALRQALLCDSLQIVHDNARMANAQAKNADRMYTADLQRNLEQQRINYAEERHLSTVITILLALTLLASIILALLYRQRQRQLNILYARQKEIEQLETDLSEVQSQTTRETELPADKQLFLRIERQMHEEQWFLNPDFSRDDLCRLAGSNRMYVSTSINKYAEMNLNQWINKARVNHAIHLIRAGETNLQILAEASGFSSSTSFFRNFKQFTLLTPKQYIERENK